MGSTKEMIIRGYKTTLRHCTSHPFLSLAALGLLLTLSGCGSADEIGGAGQCGGAEDTAACVRITSIQPKYLDQNSTNVDVIQDACDEDDPDTPQIEGLEEFKDHLAVLTITNSPLPGAAVASDPPITLQDYSVEYILNSCPAGAVCPDLSTLASGQTVTIGPNSSVSITLPFVQLAKRNEFLDKGGDPATFPSYTAVYTITGTDAFNRPVSIRGKAEFTIGWYDYCS